jgi:nitroreductase
MYLMDKPVDNEYPIHDLLRRRWSPRAFAQKPVTPEQLRSLFEAVRWSESCFNEQPWRFLVATKKDPTAFEKMLGCLTEGNQRWAQAAPVLIITLAKTTFDADGSTIRTRQYDLGLGVQNLVVQATAMGLMVRQMAGIQIERIREVYHVADDHEVMTGIAVGYQGSLSELHERYHEREQKPRRRIAMRDFVFGGDFGQSADFVE